MSKPYERRADLIRRGDAIDAVLERVAKIGGPGWRWRMNDLAAVLADVPAAPRDPRPVPYPKVREEDLNDRRIIQALRCGFYGSMYTQCSASDLPIIHIEPGKATVGADGNLYFRWGCPGPDYNIYKPEDYGQTWALTKEELVKEGAVDA